MHNNKPLRQKNRLTNIILNIEKMKNGHVKKYHVLHDEEIKVISNFCKENKIIHEILNEYYNNKFGEIIIKNNKQTYIRVWKGYRPKFSLSLPYNRQFVKYFLVDGTESSKSIE